MFITVLHGDNQRSLFNTQCKTVVLMDWIKLKCGCEHDDEVDLANLSGQVMNLPHRQATVASDILSQREEYILISVNRTSDPLNPVHTSLLHNFDLHDPQCLAKLREEKTEKQPCADSADSTAACAASTEANRLSRRLTPSLSTESQPRPSKQIRFSSATIFQTYPV